MDLNYEFEKRCRDSAHEIFAEVLVIIKDGKLPRLNDRLHNLIYEFTDRMVPIPTIELHKYIDYFEEFWDDVDHSGTFDNAFRQAVFWKAGNFIGDELDKICSWDQIDWLEEAYRLAESAMKADDYKAKYETAAILYPAQFEALGWPPVWPPVEPSLLKIFEDNQEPQDAEPKPDAPRLNLVRRPSGPL